MTFGGADCFRKLDCDSSSCLANRRVVGLWCRRWHPLILGALVHIRHRVGVVVDFVVDVVVGVVVGMLCAFSTTFLRWQRCLDGVFVLHGYMTSRGRKSDKLVAAQHADKARTRKMLGNHMRESNVAIVAGFRAS